MSPAAYTCGWEVCICSFTFTLAPCVLMPRFSIPRFFMIGRRPTLTNILSASIVPALSFSSTKTFSAETSVTLVFKKNSTPFFLYSDRSIVEVSLSIFPNISGSISITFTFTPMLLKNEANSIPITPPPIIANDFGKSLRSSASREVQYLTSDNPLIGGITVSEPVDTNTFFTKYSFPSQ